MPQNDQIWPKIGIFVHFGPGLDGSFGALFVGCLVVVVRGLYLARHLYTLFTNCQENKQGFNIDDAVGDRRENLNQV